MHEIRHFLRAAIATPVGTRRRTSALSERARPGRVGHRLGYDYAWEVEHHFLEEYSHSPAPEVFLGAASQRTKNIRLCHGIMQLTTTHPARCAERIAALDLVSNGASNSAPARAPASPNWSRSASLTTRSGRSGRRRSRPSSRCSQRTPSSITASISRCRCERRAEADPEAAPAAVGGLLGARHDRDGGRRGLGALAFSSCRPTRRMPGCTPITTPLQSASRSSAIT